MATTLPTNDRTRDYSRTYSNMGVPNLSKVQLDSFQWLIDEGIKEVLTEVSPVEDFANGRFQLSFVDYRLGEPRYSETECRDREITFDVPLYVTTELWTRVDDERKLQELFVGYIPMMTSSGTFIINGAERVIVSQLVRSPGAYFTADTDLVTGRKLASAKLIPYRGTWLEFETSQRDLITVKVDRRRKFPVYLLLRALDYTSEQEIMDLFADVDTDPLHPYIKATIAKDMKVESQEEAKIEFYRRIRPGEPPNITSADTLVDSLFFNERRYDLGRVGRYKLNHTFGRDEEIGDKRVLDRRDVVNVIKEMIRINNNMRAPDDIDHLGNRRVRGIGELYQNQIRLGFVRMERVIRERMTTQVDPQLSTPAALINAKPVIAAIREFFGGSQLSQFMDQTNPLSELTHKRRLSALGPGGLSRERAGFDVRDVHESHYGRICPIETPEGPNIGLLGSLATYAKTNEFGFIQTPYVKVYDELSSHSNDILGRIVTENIKDSKGNILIGVNKKISKALMTRIHKLPEKTIKVSPYVKLGQGDIEYLTALDEKEIWIAQSNSVIDSTGQFSNSVVARQGEKYEVVDAQTVKYMDVAPLQIVSISTALIPFLEHDDANRALMGSNMQRQAVPLVRPQYPLVGTGMEDKVAHDSGHVLVSTVEGEVIKASDELIIVRDDNNQEVNYPLRKFVRSNQGTCINHRPMVLVGDHVKVGSLLADSTSTKDGKLALGQNVNVAFMSWYGFNFEDAIILSESMVKDDRFTSMHIEKFEIEARDTKLGPEEITRDIPNIGDEILRDLDEEGIIRIGAQVVPGDILVGKITPKGETELSAEEKLLRAIFGEKARDVRDTSLRVPHGERGTVIKVKVVTRRDKDIIKNSELSPGVNTLVRVWVAQSRKVSEGDKMAGRHGNKGIIARILPEEDMPFLADGTPVDVILNPLGVPSRMNLGQILETHLGDAAYNLGFDTVTPVFDGATDLLVEDALAESWLVKASGAVVEELGPGRNLLTSIDWELVKNWFSDKGYDYNKVFEKKIPQSATNTCLIAWFDQELGKDVSGWDAEDIRKEALRLDREKHLSAPIFGKRVLYDGLTGEIFDQPVTVGNIYMMKLTHLVEDKVHARSTGPYSLITQQPLGGKVHFGGQRFGEMEVWALEAYSAAYNLQEMLTVKSDDVVGRMKTYEAIVKGEDIERPGIPESFHVLLKELQSLGLAVELQHDHAGIEDGVMLDDIESLGDMDVLSLEAIEEQIGSIEGEEEVQSEEEIEKEEVQSDEEIEKEES